MPKPQAQVRILRKVTRKEFKRGIKTDEQLLNEFQPSPSNSGSCLQYFAPLPPPDIHSKPNSPPRASAKQKNKRPTNSEISLAKDGVFLKFLPVARVKNQHRNASSEVESPGSVDADSGKQEPKSKKKNSHGMCEPQLKHTRKEPKPKDEPIQTQAERLVTKD